MLSSDNHIDLIEKYLDGSLNDHEQLEFERLLKQSPDFRGQLKDAQHTIASLKNSFDLKVKEELKGMYYETLRVEEVRHKHRYYYAAAATVLILVAAAVGTYVKIKGSSSEDLFHAYYQAYPVGPYTRGNNGDQRDQAVKFYEDNDFANALPIFIAERERESNNSLTSLYIGNCYLNLGMYSEATDAFASGLKSPDPIIAQTCKWYLALSHLASGQTGKCVFLLKEIVQKDELYSKESTNLLSEEDLDQP
jgi:TolA-binding protein